VLGEGGCTISVPFVDWVARRVEVEDFIGVGKDGGVDNAVADGFIIAGWRIGEDEFSW